MIVRPVEPTDFAAIAELQARYDIRWIGAPERDDAEMAEAIEQATAAVVILEGDAVVAAAWTDPPRATLTIDPDVAPRTVLDEILPWLTERRARVEVFSRDEPLRVALADVGWSHLQSSFDLVRSADGIWLDEPQWPVGVTVTDFSAATPEQVHQLIYADAGWAEVPGHIARSFEDWSRIFVSDKDLPEQQVLAWRDGVLVGVATGRIFADGSGWIGQLAVARSQRRTGLGRALLLEGLRRRVAAGATTVGLGVQAANAGAIALYTGVGLEVVREWQVYAAQG